MSFSKYLLQFTKNTSSEQTHLSFNNGKYNVPDEKLDEFYKRYFNVISDVKNDERNSLYLIEKVYNSTFAFFIDLDVPKRSGYKLSDDDVLDVKLNDDGEIEQLICENNTYISDFFIDCTASYGCICFSFWCFSRVCLFLCLVYGS